MTCPHLEKTSAIFDGAVADDGHTCDECRAFLVDAAQLRESLRGIDFVETPRRRLAPVLVPAMLVVVLVLVLLLRPKTNVDDAPFAGLDGGGRAVITVKDAR